MMLLLLEEVSSPNGDDNGAVCGLFIGDEVGVANIFRVYVYIYVLVQMILLWVDVVCGYIICI